MNHNVQKYREQFISIKNQELLWSVINSFPYFIEKFNEQPYFKKDEWFKYIVEQVYNETQNHEEQKEQKIDLLSMNKRTLLLMIDTFILKPPTTAPMEMVQIDTIGVNIGETSPFHLKKSEINFEESFLIRQNEYNTLLEKNTPTIDFLDKTEDTPISNMNELIEKYKKDRDILQQEVKPILYEDGETVLDISMTIVDKKSVSWGDD